MVCKLFLIPCRVLLRFIFLHRFKYHFSLPFAKRCVLKPFNHGERKKICSVCSSSCLHMIDLVWYRCGNFRSTKWFCLCCSQEHVGTICFIVEEEEKITMNRYITPFFFSHTGLRLLMCVQVCFPCGTAFICWCSVCIPHICRKRSVGVRTADVYLLFIVCVIIVAVIMPLEHFTAIKTLFMSWESKLCVCLCMRVCVDYELQQVKSNGWHQLQWLCVWGEDWKISRWKKLKRKCERTCDMFEKPEKSANGKSVANEEKT